MWAFLVGVFTLYGILFSISPDRTLKAFVTSLHIMLQILFPLSIAFVVLIFLNHFVKSEQISRLLGRRTGLRGIALSCVGGILSMGPIYAWYPLLKGFREKGISDFYLANFLSSRAIKPFLFPVMVFYFGWAFTLILNILMLAESLLIAKIISLANEGRQ